MSTGDFVKRSMQIVARGFGDTVTNYFDSGITFFNDVKQIKNESTENVKDGIEKFNQLRHSGIIKRIKDWFYDEEGMLGDYMSDGDDFDSGMDLGDDSDEGEEKQPKPLTRRDIEEASKKQTGSIYKALGKTADLHIANTAEIISSVNTKSAEITTAVNNVNKTLIEIGKRLDLIVEYTSTRISRESQTQRKEETSIFDYGGRLSLSGIYSGLKSKATDNMAMSMLSSVSSLSSMFTPEALASMLFSMGLFNIRMGSGPLKGKSVNDIGDSINELIGQSINNALTKLITSEKGFLKNIFEDVISGSSRTDFSKFAKEQYTDKPAIFDGVTRKSIITIIPGYLNEILKAVNNGKGKYINAYGNLTDKDENPFVKQAGESLYRMTADTSANKKRVYESIEITQPELAEKISRVDLEEALREYQAQWIYWIYSHTRKVLKVGECVDYMKYSSTQEVVQRTIRRLNKKYSGMNIDWGPIVIDLISGLDDDSFRETVQSNYSRFMKNMRDYAETNTHGYMATELTRELFEQASDLQFSLTSEQKRYITEHTVTNKAESNNSSTGGPFEPSQIGSSGSSKFTEIDFLAGIFRRLNTGINVFVTGTAKNNKRRNPYEPISLSKAYTANPNNFKDSGDGSVNDVVNATKAAVSHTDKALDIGMDFFSGAAASEESKSEQQELNELEKKLNTNGSLSSQEQERLDELRKKLGSPSKRIINNVKNIINGNSNINLKNAIPETSNVINKIDNIFPGFKDKATPVVNDLKQRMNEAIDNTNINEKINNKVNGLLNDVFGEQTTNEKGETIRSGGIVGSVKESGKNIASDLKDKITNGYYGLSTAYSSDKKLMNNWEQARSQFYDKMTQSMGNVDNDNDSEKQLEMLQDSNIVKEIDMLVNTAMSDNNPDIIDANMINEKIDMIHDAELKRSMKKSVVPLMRRQNKGKHNYEEETNKSTLGKIIALLKWAATPAMALLAKWFKWIPAALTKYTLFGYKVIAKYGQKLLMSGLKDIKYGTKSLVSGVWTQFKMLMKPAVAYVDFMHDKVRPAINKSLEKLIHFPENLSKKIKEKYPIFVKDLTKLGNFVKKGASSIFKTLKDAITGKKGKGGIFGAISDSFESLVDKSKKNGKLGEFFEGFWSAHDAKKQASLKTKIDSGKENINGAADAYAGEQVSILQSIRDLVGKLVNKGEVTDDGGEPSLDMPEASSSDEPIKQENNSMLPDNNAAPNSNNLGQRTNGGLTEANGHVPGTNDTRSGTNDTSSGARSAGEKVGSLLGSIGQVVGGIQSILMGIFKIIASVVVQFESFKALTKLYMSGLKYALKPLESLFKYIKKTFTPFFKRMAKVYKDVVETITPILKILFEFGTIMTKFWLPILESLSPVLDVMTEFFEMISDIMTDVLDVCLMPLTIMMKTVVTPVITLIADVLKTIAGGIMMVLGGIEYGFGAVLTVLGSVLSVVGKLIPSVHEVADEYSNSGNELMSSGRENMKSGYEFLKQGIKGIVADMVEMLSLGIVTVDRDDDEDTTPKIIDQQDEDIVSNTYANGDVFNNTYNTWNTTSGNHSNDIYNTYGGEYQRGMGGYLNMNQRGCGPIALADAYNRRGGNVSARGLAASMYGSGAYDPNRGTSIASYVNAGRALGMNMHAGGVNSKSLKQATPNNPITVVGSGPDYGTRTGNNHFMNVIGSDKHGNSYVSNPLTGRVDKKPTATLANSAVMGIYAGGDYEEDGYTFPDAIKDAFTELKEQASKIIGLFQMDDNDFESQLEEAQQEQAISQAKKSLGDKFEEFETAAKNMAIEDYQKMYPKRDSQTDDDYQQAFEKWYKSKEAKYIAKVTITDVANPGQEINVFDAASQWNQTISDNLIDNENGSLSKLVNGTLEKLQNKLFESSKKASAGTKSTSKSGRGSLSELYHAASEVWEAVAEKAGGPYYSYDNFGPVTTRSGVVLDVVHPDCSGMLSATMNLMGYDFKGTMNGSNKRWTTHDIVGKTDNNFIYKDGELTNDWTFIPYSSDEVKEGDILVRKETTTNPDQHVGLYVEGNSSDAKGFDAGIADRLPKLGEAAKAYLSGDSDWKSKLQWTMGPGYDGLTTILRYTKPSSGSVELTGDLATYSAWSKYKDNPGVPTFIEAGESAGMTGPEIATIMSTGIWEDSGEKIFGIKSLNDTTYDYRSQAAKGIMNWVDQNVSYGNTVLDQLKYIRGTYFDQNSSDYRAFVRNTGYWDADLNAYKAATGRDGYQLKLGDRYGPYLNEDLIEGSAFFFMDALVPEKIHTAQGMAENVGTAAEAYNWMIDNGYVDNVAGPVEPAKTVYGPTQPTSSSSKKNTASSSSNNTSSSYSTSTPGYNPNGVQAILGTSYYKRIPWESEDKRWNPSYYTDPENYKYFLESDSKGDMSPVANGMFTRLSEMTNNILNEGTDSKYYGNLETNQDYDAERTFKAFKNDFNTTEKWFNQRQDFVKRGAKKSLFDDGLGAVHAALYGSGDSDEKTFWDTYLGWNSSSDDTSYTSQTYVPDLNTPMMNYVEDDASQQRIVNLYNITRTNDKQKEEEIKAILTNTYNVRSETMELLLNNILEEIKKKDKTPKNGRLDTNGSTNLFSDEIPTQITKMSIG